MLKSTSLKSLLNFTKQALMTLLGCQRVGFLLKHSEFVDAAIRENIIMETVKIELCKKISLSHSHTLGSLEMVLMTDIGSSIQGEQEAVGSGSFNVHFKELKMGMRGYFKDRIYVQPFHKLISPHFQ